MLISVRMSTKMNQSHLYLFSFNRFVERGCTIKQLNLGDQNTNNQTMTFDQENPTLAHKCREVFVSGLR